jgi:hypothetical protein
MADHLGHLGRQKLIKDNLACPGFSTVCQGGSLASSKVGRNMTKALTESIVYIYFWKNTFFEKIFRKCSNSLQGHYTKEKKLNTPLKLFKKTLVIHRK